MNEIKVVSRHDLARLIDHLGLRHGVEVGVYQGAFSYYILRHSALAHLLSVDMWMEKHYKWKHETENVLAEFGARSSVLHSLSVAAAEKIPDGGMDFVYIDAGHRYGSVKQDIAAWWPKLRVGGVFSGHDYLVANKCDVIAAVDEFMATRPEKLRLTVELLTTWWLVKERE